MVSLITTPPRERIFIFDEVIFSFDLAAISVSSCRETYAGSHNRTVHTQTRHLETMFHIFMSED